MKKWIANAIKAPGALRRTAKREGLVEGDEKLSSGDLSQLSSKAERSGNLKLKRRVNLAKTLRSFSK